MKTHFQKILIAGKKQRNGDIAATLDTLIAALTKAKKKIWLEKNSAEFLKKQPKNLALIAANQITNDIDLIITVGGDGTILGLAKIAAQHGIPMLGINRGYLGFLTDVKPEQLAIISAICAGEFKIEERFLLQAKVIHKNKIIAQDFALNDIILAYGESDKMVEFTTSINNELVCSHRADGMIIATPTGSTAYALSAGGPIVHPNLDAIALVPMFSHNLSSRPIVISGTSEIAIKITEKNRFSAYINCDGQKRIEAPVGSTIKITKAQEKLKLIHPLTYNYFETLRSKLYWERL